MGKISGWYVIAGGVLAALVLMAEQAFVNFRMLDPMWQEWWNNKEIKDLMIAQAGLAGACKTMAVLDLCTGLVVAWLYAAVRPRLGAGLMTAIVTGLIVWALVLLQGYLPAMVWCPKFRQVMPVCALGDLVGYLVAASLAGWVYRERGDTGEGRRKAR
jgi:fructose-specific phosphotransferase system IIC component